MTTGRIRLKDRRVYVDGYDVSGMSRTIGPLELTYAEADLTATMGDQVKGYLRNNAQVNVGTLNTVFDDTATTGVHTVLNAAAGTRRTVLVAQGQLAAPAIGDTCFGGQFAQDGYQVLESSGAMVVNADFSGWAADASSTVFACPHGILLHANTAETGVNSAIGQDNGGATAGGGYMVYHVLAGNGTATIKVQDAATNLNASFADLAGATSGVVNCAVVQYGMIAATTLAVRQFTRWQIVLGTATSVTFVLGIFRA